MKQFLLGATILASSLLLIPSCRDKDNAPSAKGTEQTNDQGQDFIIGTTIGNPGGQDFSLYLRMIPSLSGQYTNNEALRVPGLPPMVFGNHLYTFPEMSGQGASEVVQYSIGKDSFASTHHIPVPTGMIFSLFENKAGDTGYIMGYSQSRLFSFDPTTGKRTNRDIDLSSYAQAGLLVAPSLMIERDGYYFLGLDQIDPTTTLPKLPQAEMLVIDAKTKQVVKKIVDTKHRLSFATRPIDQGSIFEDEQGDIYVACLGSFAQSADLPGGYLRIKKGQTDFDPDWSIDLSKVVLEGLDNARPGDASYPAQTRYLGNGKVAAYVTVSRLDPEANPYTAHNNVAIVIDLKTKKAQYLKGLPPADQAGIALGLHQGKLIVGSSNKDTYGFYSYDPAHPEQSAQRLFTVEGAPAFFWSRTPR